MNARNERDERDLEDAGREAAQAADSARERLASDLQVLSEHAQEMLRVTSAVSGESVAAAREQLEHAVSVASDSLRRWRGEALDQGRRAARRADTYVHENPWQSIAAGACVGLAIGLACNTLRGAARA